LKRKQNALWNVKNFGGSKAYMAQHKKIDYSSTVFGFIVFIDRL